MPLEDALRLYPHTRRFEVIRVLGTGGMGVVYEAIDRERNTRVALKTLRSLDAEALLRFKREFRALQDIQHPNLVSLGELVEESGQLFFTMELVHGVDFIEHVRPRARVDHTSSIAVSAEETLARAGGRIDAAPQANPSAATVAPVRGAQRRATVRPPPRPPSAPPVPPTTTAPTTTAPTTQANVRAAPARPAIPPPGAPPLGALAVGALAVGAPTASAPSLGATALGGGSTVNSPSHPPRGATGRPPVGTMPGSAPPPAPTVIPAARPSRPSSPLPPRPTMRPGADATIDLPASAMRDRRQPWNWMVRNGQSFDETRLRRAFGQLARGIHALHASQKVHRDIKPSNVLVTEQGRVVILDFGLIADVEHDERDASLVVGTAHFMAPEQAAAKDVGPEADWYSMGAMLYLALTGYYPFQLSPDVVLDFKQCVEPSPPSLLVEGLPADLEALCVELLRLDPKARPSGVDVLRRLHAEEEGAEESPLSSYTSTFIGRWSELDALDQALEEVREGTAVVTLIEGESGMGKSALVRRFLEQFAADALVLQGRCYERDSVPYKAVDEIIDQLSHHLDRLPREDAEELLPPNTPLLANVFPVLKKVAAVSERQPDPAEVKDPLEVRAKVFAVLREIFCRISAHRPLVLAIDDLQWADADGIALLCDVMRPPDAPRVLLLAALRSDADSSRVQRARKLGFQGRVRTVQLGQLAEDEAIQLAKLLLRTASMSRRAGSGSAAGAANGPAVAEGGGAPSSEQGIDVNALVDEAGGHPLFIDALVRHRLAQTGESTPVRLEDALWSRIQRLDRPAGRLLELVAVAGGPLPQGIASHTIAADFDELTRLLGTLRVANLIRTSGAGKDDVIEILHDRIRETVMSRLNAQTQRAWHGRLALTLEAADSNELERLAVHWNAAGDRARAGGYALRAADQASTALAFDRAAKLYRMAIDLAPRSAGAEWTLLARLGDALGNAGRGLDAAEAYLRASAQAPAGEALELKRRTAEAFLRSGYVDEGMACLRDVLHAVGMEVPETPSAAMTALLFRRTELRLRGYRYETREPEQIAESKLIAIDICWSAALGLGLVDHIRGAYFQSRHLLLALRAGDPYRIARALTLELTFTGAMGTPARSRLAELLDVAREAVERSGHAHALALLPTFTGLALFFEGEFQSALIALDRGETTLRERCASASWERDSALAFSVHCLWFQGDLRGLARRVPDYLREADERGDRYLAAHLRSGFANTYWLLRDEPEEALRHATEALSNWSRAGFHLQHFYDMLARAQIALYRGEDEEAHRYVSHRWGDLEASMHLRIQLVRVVALHIRARTALAASRSSAEAPALLELAAKAARELESEDAGWVQGLAALTRASVAVLRGERDKAETSLDRALEGFRAANMELFAALSRRAIGRLLGDAKGKEMVADVDRWLVDRGVVRPERLAAMLTPGL
jgi:eukaryotic-like serine/threonine-protein kinase